MNLKESKVIINNLEMEKVDTRKNTSEMFDKISDIKDPSKALDALMVAFDHEVKMFPLKELELEVKFGTKGIRRVTKNDFDNVVKVLKSMGFTTDNSQGSYTLRVYSEFTDHRGKKRVADRIRTEINGLDVIQRFCKSGDNLQEILSDTTDVKFIKKMPYIHPIDFDDFNFRVSLQEETHVDKSIVSEMKRSWLKTKKEFRYLNRVTFQHSSFPIKVDMSIVKTGSRNAKHQIIPCYTSKESRVFQNPASYEIEIEVDCDKAYTTGETFTPKRLATDLRKVIRYVLTGLQGTKYPVSYSEQENVQHEYMITVFGPNYNGRISSREFIGPNSVTLQRSNIGPVEENCKLPNIHKDFVVTDKADGERHLLFVTSTGRIYLMSTNMDIKFTGAVTNNKDLFSTLIDGELIVHGKSNQYINLFAAFDVYYRNKEDVRHLPFWIDQDDMNEKTPCRYGILKQLESALHMFPVIEMQKDSLVKQPTNNNEWVEHYSERQKRPFWYNNVTGESSWEPKIVIQERKPTNINLMQLRVKEFYPITRDNNGCKVIFDKECGGFFEYNTDGLIFTHTLFGVGAEERGKAGPKQKITWKYSFKWKPPQYNTIDFLVSTQKTPTGADIVQPLLACGTNTHVYQQIQEYKTLILRCGFSEKNDGFLNPCQDIIDDRIPSDKPSAEYLPVRFYPTEPYDSNAGIANIMLTPIGKQMLTESKEVFGDNMIVEFRYDFDQPEGWRWIPLRVRHDKTNKMLRGEKEFGNSYKVCNENWRSIHPVGRITEKMLTDGSDDVPSPIVSEDIYYNTPSGEMHTAALKNFHNLYVKKLLITCVSHPGDTLIDFACGKAGDLPKWIAAQLSFVFGIDYSVDNLENRLDGACARYLKMRTKMKKIPGAIFVHGNSALNIQNGTAMQNEKAKQITDAVFGVGPKSADKIGEGVAKQYGKGMGGFHISSCQFALHYFFKGPESLLGFLRNVAECTKEGGYFIGTCFDGLSMFQLLKGKKQGDSIQYNKDGKKIWSVTKEYHEETFEADSSCIGYEIKVYQESINQSISEYLVHFDYLTRLLECYGFHLVSEQHANLFGLPQGSGMFEQLFVSMEEELKSTPESANHYGDAPKMTELEKRISFLNRYFVYQKVRTVNLEKIQIDLDDCQHALEKRSAKELTNSKSKKRLLLSKEDEDENQDENQDEDQDVNQEKEQIYSIMEEHSNNEKQSKKEGKKKAKIVFKQD